MANEKKYASLDNLRTFKENTDGLYATNMVVEELSSEVAYIDQTSNETITDVETGGGSGGTGGGTGGTSIDVTAEVGQTIIVKEVDANGKPTKWESADYQPRTHWTEETVIIPETTQVIDPEMGSADFENVSLSLTMSYKVKYNGAEYLVSNGFGSGGEVYFGNLAAVAPNMVDTGEPFVLGSIDSDGERFLGIIPLDGSESITVSVTEVKYNQIPKQYISHMLPFVLRINKWVSLGWKCPVNIKDVEAAFAEGKQITYQIFSEEDGRDYYALLMSVYRDENIANGRVIVLYCLGFGVITLTPNEDGTYNVTVSE